MSSTTNSTSVPQDSHTEKTKEKNSSCSYQVQENGPCYNVLHNVLCFKLFMGVWSKCHKEVNGPYGKYTAKERQSVVL